MFICVNKFLCLFVYISKIIDIEYDLNCIDRCNCGDCSLCWNRILD